MILRALLLSMIVTGIYTSDPTDPPKLQALAAPPETSARTLWCFNGALGEDCTAGTWVRDRETYLQAPPFEKSPTSNFGAFGALLHLLGIVVGIGGYHFFLLLRKEKAAT